MNTGPFRHGKLESLNGSIECGLFWFVHQQMNMLGHDDVSDDDEFVALPDAFESRFEEVACLCGTEIRLAAETTESDEVEVSGVMETVEALGH